MKIEVYQELLERKITHNNHKNHKWLENLNFQPFIPCESQQNTSVAEQSEQEKDGVGHADGQLNRAIAEKRKNWPMILVKNGYKIKSKVNYGILEMENFPQMILDLVRSSMPWALMASVMGMQLAKFGNRSNSCSSLSSERRLC